MLTTVLFTINAVYNDNNGARELIPYVTDLLEDIRIHHLGYEIISDFHQFSNDFNPADCLAIVATPSELKAAKQKKISCIAYTPCYDSTRDFSLADIIIEGYDEITSLFLQQIYERSHHLPVTIAVTDTLTLCELTCKDTPRLYRILTSHEVNRFLKPMNDTYDVFSEKQNAYRETSYQFYGYGFWGIYLNATNELIGQCGIQNNTIDGIVEYELGYVLANEYWHHGYATLMAEKAIEYGFDSLGLDRIVAVIAKENLASIHVAQNLGMKFEKEILHDTHTCLVYTIHT